MRAIASIAAIVLLLTPWAAGAQEVAPPSLATIDTVTYAPIPPGARLVTQPETQGEMDDSAWRQANEDLVGRGYQVGNDGNLVFTVATQLVERLGTDKTQGEIVSGSAVSEGMQYSTNERTLLNPEEPINRTDRIFRVSATVYDRQNGAFVWRGTAERSNAEIDPSTALRLMLPALLDHFGETASGVAVPMVP
ncbi:hypothetical protein [Dongia sp.]|uniref:hypothetical protein n=1 Tax=Dongia sp. TaxID=1977262 RepID=UPI0035B138FA